MRFGIVLFVARILSLIAIPIASLIGIFHPKIRRGLSMRRSKHQREHWKKGPSNSQPIWIHCSSGEFEYAKGVIRELKNEDKDTKILVTYFSPTYRKPIESDPLVDFSCATPLGGPTVWNRFIEHYAPKTLLIARTDLWPEMLHQCHNHSIPIGLFSVTQSSEMTSSRSAISRFDYSALLEKIDHVFAVSENDAFELKKLAPNLSISSVGDSRFDQVFFRLENPKEIKINLKPNVPALVLGSTWSEDIQQLLPALKTAKELGAKTIIAPHEPSTNEIEPLKKGLSKEGLSFQTYSVANDFSSDVLIIDQVGVLAELYTWSQVAFVGGSFKGSVHSVMEPLAAGNLVAVGPHYKNNREAIRFSDEKLEKASDLCIVNEIQSGDDFSKLISNVFSKNKIKDLSCEISDRIKKEVGASRTIAEWAKRSI